MVSSTEQVLVPTLRPGGIVILDNLPTHKDSAARQTVEATGAMLLFLPPYSPDVSQVVPEYRDMDVARLEALLGILYIAPDSGQQIGANSHS